MLAPVTHILPLTVIRRERMLPGLGKVLVRKGQKVSANDIIAEAAQNTDHLLLDIGLGLGVVQSQADRYLQVEVGEQLAETDIIAGPVGLGRRVVRAPQSCKVILAGGGQVLLELSGTPAQIKAGLPGEVAELITDRGAIIETTGALLQGVWGNNRIDFGVITSISKEPDQVITPEQFDVSMRGSIVLGSRCERLESLQAAQQLSVRGLILASMPAGLMKAAAAMDYPIILMEGFGALPMNSIAFKLLSTSERREVAINAQSWDPFEGVRPEIVIPLPGEGDIQPTREAETFSPEKQVRVLRAPFVGKIGRVVSLRGIETFASGIRAPGVEVRFEGGETAVLPMANLEVIA